MSENVIVIKSKAFAIKIVNMYKWICEEKREYILSKQCLRSSSSIGANVAEAIRGQSKADFLAKMGIALKEANETLYHLELLFEGKYLPKEKFDEMYSDCKELLRILMAITKEQRKR